MPLDSRHTYYNIKGECEERGERDSQPSSYVAHWRQTLDADTGDFLSETCRIAADNQSRPLDVREFETGSANTTVKAFLKRAKMIKVSSMCFTSYIKFLKNRKNKDYVEANRLSLES